MSDLPRRSVLIGAALCPLATQVTGCSKDDETPKSAQATEGQTLASVADVPVGSGIIAHGTLVTQPTAGVFKGFVARCTHAGCSLGLKGKVAQCPCHGSEFELDGSVARGPATEPLAARPVMVRGTEIVTG